MEVKKIDVFKKGVVVFSGSVKKCAEYIVKNCTNGKYKSIYVLIYTYLDTTTPVRGFLVKSAGVTTSRELINYAISKNDKRGSQNDLETSSKFKYDPGCFNPHSRDNKGSGCLNRPY